MITVAREEKAGMTLIKISGALVDQEDLAQFIGSFASGQKLLFNCRHINRINSSGTRTWLKYFRGLQSQGITFGFTECSTPVVEQFNFFHNFNCGGHIESVYIPYLCNHCKTESHVLFTTADLIKIQPVIPPIKCPSCKQQAEFDDIPDQFFRFTKGLKT